MKRQAPSAARGRAIGTTRRRETPATSLLPHPPETSLFSIQKAYRTSPAAPNFCLRIACHTSSHGSTDAGSHTAALAREQTGPPVLSLQHVSRCSTKASQQPLPNSPIRRRSPLQRFLLQICADWVGLTSSSRSTVRLRKKQTRRPTRRSAALPPEARSPHILAPPFGATAPARQQSRKDAIALLDGRHPSPASACTRLQIAGSATVTLCSPASSQATLAPLLSAILAPSDPRLRQHAPSSSPPHTPASVPVLSIDTYTRPPSPSPDFLRLI